MMETHTRTPNVRLGGRRFVELPHTSTALAHDIRTYVRGITWKSACVRSYNSTAPPGSPAPHRMTRLSSFAHARVTLICSWSCVARRSTDLKHTEECVDVISRPMCRFVCKPLYACVCLNEWRRLRMVGGVTAHNDGCSAYRKTRFRRNVWDYVQYVDYPNAKWKLQYCARVVGS